MLPENPSRLTSEDDIIRRLRERSPGSDLRIPPRCFEEMKGEIQAFDPEAKSLNVRMPVEERYDNPMGVMQGGFLGAALDNAFGPLSYLVAPPSVTTQMNLTFLRPVREVSFVDVEVRVEEQAGKQLQMSGRVLLPSGKTAVTATVTCQVLHRGLGEGGHGGEREPAPPDR